MRSFVDDAALAGLAEVRVVHGRGTGAVRAAVRDELDGHPLVDRRESDSADGATVAHLERLDRLLDHLRGVQLVRQLLEDPQARLGHVEEALERERLQPGEVGTRLEHARSTAERSPPSATCSTLSRHGPSTRAASAGGGVDQLSLLLAAAAAEPVRRRAALLVAALDEARADLRGDELLALEDADRVAADPDEQRRRPRSRRSASSSGSTHDLSYSPSCSRPNGGVTVSVPSVQLETGAAVA